MAVPGVALVVSAAACYPAMLPAATFEESSYADARDIQLETIGWVEYTDQPRAVVDSLAPEQHSAAVVLTANYGETSAMSWCDVSPPVYSGHIGYRE